MVIGIEGDSVRQSTQLEGDKCVNIIVYNTAASGGGGITILNEHIERAEKDTDHQWWFIVSFQGLKDSDAENVHILYRKELDKTGIRRWVNRILFEQIKLKRIISEINPDRVLSLQNMTMPKARCPQTVYLHQSLQFAPVKFSFLKKEERALAIRQRIICSLIRRNLKKADGIIVQTEWMREATAKWAGISAANISVQTPAVPCVPVDETMIGKRRNNAFFYPAGNGIYKNHQVIIDACKLLKKEGITEYSVEFTLNRDDNLLTKRMFEEIKREQLPISFIGYQSQKVVYSKYAEQALLFPSYIETFGLPLLEAQQFGTEVLASDCKYAREVLGEYDHCRFLKWNDAAGWAEAMRKLIFS